MINNNKHLMMGIVEQYYNGNFQIIIDNITENIKWTSHKMANVQLSNKKDVIEFLKNVPVGRFSFENNNFIVDDNNIVVEGVCRYKNKEGKLIENYYCDIFTFSNNKIEKVSAYFI